MNIKMFCFYDKCKITNFIANSMQTTNLENLSFFSPFMCLLFEKSYSQIKNIKTKRSMTYKKKQEEKRNVYIWLWHRNNASFLNMNMFVGVYASSFFIIWVMRSKTLVCVYDFMKNFTIGHNRICFFFHFVRLIIFDM